MRTTLTLAGCLLTMGLGLGSATAAPAMPRSEILADQGFERAVTDRHSRLRYTGKTDKAYRMHRRTNTHMHGNPNARNPAQPGYAQQLGNTTNGPRY